MFASPGSRARGDSHHARSLCALSIKERAPPASSGSRLFTFIARNSTGFLLCLASAPLSSLSSALLSALSSALLSSLPFARRVRL